MSTLFAILTGMGVGSGGLYILWQTLVKGVPQAEAQGLNLMFFSLCVFSASLVNFRRHRIATKPALIIIPLGIAAGIPAVMLARSIDTGLLSKLFGGFLILVGSVGLLSRSK